MSLSFRSAWFLWLLLLLAPSISAAQDDSLLAGPLRSRNHHPIFMNLLNPPPESPLLAQVCSWEVAVNHSNIFAMGANENWYIHMDKEITESDILLRAPLAQGKYEIGAEMPIIVSSAGFLDPLVRTYHAAVGVPGYDWQDHFPDGFYVDKLYYHHHIFSLGRQNSILPGDATFWLKGYAAQRENLLAAWQLFIQVPTGSADAGTGSGNWEFGGRAMGRLEYRGLGIYSSLGLYFPGMLKGQGASVTLLPIYSGFLGFEWTLWGGWAFLAQFTYTSSPLDGQGYDYFSKPWIDSTFGFKRVIGPGKTMGFALSENLNQTSPDFTIHISLAM
ncbi:MAG: DUF3187 family protein [Nitrospinota bacterium]|nr:DUF3187 family protein [Nitrospinota bacterium]